MSHATNTQNFADLKKVDHEFSDTSMDLIQKWSAHYGELFLKSEIAKLSLSEHAFEEFPFILGSFCDFCYSYHLQKPGQWTSMTVKDVCVNIMPRKVVADNAFFSLIASVLPNFLTWMSTENHLSDTCALQKTIRAAEKNIVSNAQNPNIWGMGKSLAMGAQAKGYDMSNPDAINAALMRENPNELLQMTQVSKKRPSQKHELHTIDDITNDLRYLTSGFPKAAVEAALGKQKEITPILLDFLNEAIQNCETLEETYFGHLHALFLLSYFREKKAFPLVMKMASLPQELPEEILGDTITEDFHRIIASVYDGNIKIIQQLIENKNVNIWSRNAALKSYLVLVKANVLERHWVIEYYRGLFNHDAFINDDISTTNLVSSACDLYPKELYPEIDACFTNGRIDLGYLDMDWVSSVLAMGQETALNKYLYENDSYDLINNVIKNMEWWACFQENEEEDLSCGTGEHV